MRASPARVVAHRVVRRVFEEDAFADRAFRGEAAELDPRDRALAMRLAYGTVQRKGTLAWITGRLAKGRLEPGVRAALWIGLYQLLYSGVPDHAAVAESVELAKPSQGHRVVNAVLRRVQREGVELPSDLHGVEYQPFDPAGAWKSKLARELHAAGVQFDPMKVL